MPSRPDLRELATNVRDAFADADRETLLDILTFVVKEYVVEGPPPMLVHQAETLADLQGASFAQLISALQTRFDHPELAMFVVDGEQVGVRIGGVVQPLLPTRQPLTGAAPTPAADLPRPAAGVRVVETTLAQRPPTAAQPAAAPASAPPPVRGLSMRGMPTSGGGAPQPAPQAAPAPSAPPAAAAPPPQGAPAAPASDKSEKEPPADEASTRFSLLELD